MALMDGTAGTHENDKLDAAVITVSTLTGFLATRVVLEQKVQLKFEGFEGWIEADRLVDKLKKAIQSQGLGRGFLSIKTDTFDEHDRQRGYLMKGTPEVRDGRALDLRAYAITGRAGGQMASGLDLHKAMLSEPAKDLVAQLLESSYKQFNAPGEGAGTSDSMYKERGAYYGVYDDQVTDKCGFISTTRRLIDTTDGGEGARWNSRLARAGLIHTDKQRQQPVTAPSFGSFETPKVERWAAGEGKDDRVVGYCHGMNWAIMHARLIGPWVTPYEIAVGTETTKLASCFGCTTFMYSSGFPPSAVHLGRAESWVPLPNSTADNPHYDPAHHQAVIDGLNAAWATDVAGYLYLGSRVLKSAEQFTADARGRANVLHDRVKQLRDRKDGSARDTANIFLDALTVHDKEENRLKLVLGAG